MFSLFSKKVWMKKLIRDGQTLGEMMPVALAEKWEFILER